MTLLNILIGYCLKNSSRKIGKNLYYVGSINRCPVPKDWSTLIKMNNFEEQIRNEFVKDLLNIRNGIINVG